MKMNKKIKIIGIVVTLSLCIGACNLQKEVCDSKNCKNEVYKNGLCPDHYVKPESVKFHFYKNQPINVAIFYRLHTDYNQSYRSKGHTTPLNFNNQFIMTY